jgi:sn-glycerol 3-phosphate transport system substrate-binding protein
MPYAVSQPMLYINPSIATAAGLDPTDPPSTLEQVAQWAQQIKAKTGNYGFSMNMVDSWILEELSASGGSIFCSPENGRSGSHVTGIEMTSSTQIKLLTTLKELFQSGVALNPGTNSATMTAAFTSGKVGMVLTSSASYTAIKPSANAQVTVAQFPKTSTSKDAGAAIGGASLWISGPGHSKAEQQAAYEFAKFMDSAATQAMWSKATGFLSTNTGSASYPDGKTSLADPNVKVMYKQLKANPASIPSSGCRMGPYAAVRKIVIGAFNKIITGGDVRTEMKQAEQQAKTTIAQYNAAVK